MKKIAFISGLALALVVTGPAAAADWTWPVHGPVVTPYRNGDDPYAAGQHRGIDIGAPVGTAVVAATPGTVTFAGVAGSSGLTVAERTSDGRYELSYLHLSTASVAVGRRVEAGTRLGAVGISGRRSAEQPHLHFGVRDADARQSYHDPLGFLPPPSSGDPQPHPAPVPVAAPSRVEEAPVPSAPPLAPAGAPVSTGAPVRLPRPLELPAGHAHAAHPHASSLSSHAEARTLGPTAGTASPSGAPAAAAHPRDAHARALHPVPSAGHGPPDPAVTRAPAHGLTLHDRHASGHGAHHGIDLAWLAACIGLMVAATVLGHPLGRPGRPSALTLLRPLLRREARQ